MKISLLVTQALCASVTTLFAKFVSWETTLVSWIYKPWYLLGDMSAYRHFPISYLTVQTFNPLFDKAAHIPHSIEMGLFSKDERSVKPASGGLGRSSTVRTSTANPSTSATTTPNFSRPFPVTKTTQAPPSDGYNVMKASGDRRANQETVQLRETPAREPVKHSHYAHNLEKPQSATFHKTRPRAKSTGNKSSETYVPVSPRTYPHSIENLYIDCGIIAGIDFNTFTRDQVNIVLEGFAFDNPVAALHIMDMAKKWGLRCTFKETLRLNDSSLWQRCRPAILQREIEKAYAKGDKWVDERLSIVGRRYSRHLVQKQGLHHEIKDKVYAESKDYVWGTSDLTAPTHRIRVKELPLAVIALYSEVAGTELKSLTKAREAEIMADWNYRYPVSDYHLKRVIDKWSPAEVTPVNIDPGYKSLCAEVGSRAVNQRVRGLSDVSIDGREGRSVSTQGKNEGKGKSNLRIVN